MVEGNVFGLKRGEASKASFDEAADESLFVLAPPASLSGPLLRALEQDFGEFTIIQANQMTLDRMLLQSRARDVFISYEYLYTSAHILSKIKKHIPFARKTLIYSCNRSPAKEIVEHISIDEFDNVVNTYSNSKILNSIFYIISSGGEYICPEIIKYSILEKQYGNDCMNDIGQDSAPVANSNASPSNTLKELTRREMEILERVAYGYRNRAIAEDLYLSEHTVKVHLRNIIKKLGVYNRTNAAALFHLRHDESSS